MPFRLALSGLNAASTDLSVTANNVANVATTGFKGSRAEFADLFATSQQGVSSTAVGNGVRVANIAQQFTQGNIDFTDNSLDLAVSGSGFFIVSDAGALNYTRAGAFQVDRSGFIVNSQGQRLQAYPPLQNGGFNTGGLSDIALVTSESAPQATTAVDVTLNLPANATQTVTTPVNPADPTSYTNVTLLTVYDSLGAAHTASLYFMKGALPNEWTTQLYVDGTAVDTPQPLNYSDMGTLTTPAGGQYTFLPYPPANGRCWSDHDVRLQQQHPVRQRVQCQCNYPGWVHNRASDRH